MMRHKTILAVILFALPAASPAMDLTIGQGITLFQPGFSVGGIGQPMASRTGSLNTAIAGFRVAQVLKLEAGLSYESRKYANITTGSELNYKYLTMQGTLHVDVFSFFYTRIGGYISTGLGTIDNATPQGGGMYVVQSNFSDLGYNGLDYGLLFALGISIRAITDVAFVGEFQYLIGMANADNNVAESLNFRGCEFFAGVRISL